LDKKKENKNIDIFIKITRGHLTPGKVILKNAELFSKN
jgi:hypothetical protein